MYSVRRNDADFSLLVTNTGDGLEYHPREADPVLDGFRAMHTIQLDEIEPATLFDSSSWALLYRPLIFPAPGKKQSEHIYGKVLPFFNKRPLMCSVGSVGEGATGSNTGTRSPPCPGEVTRPGRGSRWRLRARVWPPRRASTPVARTRWPRWASDTSWSNPLFRI